MAELAPHDLTSDWSHLGYMAASSSRFASLPEWKAFDGGSAYWIGSGGGVDWLQIDLGIGASATLSSYKITVNSVPEAARAPKDFTMQGSNDGSSFTTIDTQTSQTAWSSGEQRTFTIGGSPAAYRYYRLDITANNGDATYTQVQELNLIGTVVTAQTADVAPHNMTNGTTPSPYVATASTTFGGRAAYTAFDGTEGSAGSGWMGTNSGVDWLKLDLGAGNAYILYGYIINSTDEATRAAKAWTMEGSNDGSSWDVVDTRSSQTSWVSNERRIYTCTTTTTAYRYFRLNVTESNDATYTQVGELYLYGAVAAAADPSIPWALQVLGPYLEKTGMRSGS